MLWHVLDLGFHIEQFVQDKLHVTQRRCVLSHSSSPSVQEAWALVAAESALQQPSADSPDA
jgi:hypothetical protein